ncbi:cellulose binding domain-containing protein [Catellatospora sp. KI3]|uniref:cellulose binding domain-containing protein n=1 Tax=Catellatospora sp. KI3 TaxID=3041620 RepID=UPI00248215D2|nr:cellulose binding domain-containing protein [Catellatospora sp. KI3]MDI1464087.1 cellulose binding domain-containing protein [Catellatospora sp. KI3]
MLRKSSLSAALVAALATLLVAATFALARPALSAPVPVRIMPLGDSITAGTGCWRAMLWHQLQLAGYTNIDFVGGVSDGGGCNPGYSYDFDHEGHGGYSATGIADNNQLPPWLTAARPDIVLVHLGTNDMWGHYIPTATKLTAFTKLVGQMRANNPNVKILVSQIIPMTAAACSTCPADIVEFNSALPAWAAGLTTAQSPITLVDQWTGFDAAVDTGDGVHPNNTGYQKMANRFYPALARVLGGTTPSPTASASPSPSRSASPSPSASPKPSASPTSGGAACTATYQVSSQWGGNFQGEVTVRNSGAATLSAWTAVFTYANGQQVTQSWNAAITQSGATVTARNVSYNGTLAAGASTSFGFLASWNNTANETPTVRCTAS